ncbi:MAG: hypothetical protein K0Q72_3708, partial [Armatimonadetes bacterium]|nr:hypothetical protein [Armatimonadota bacterium]
MRRAFHRFSARRDCLLGLCLGAALLPAAPASAERLPAPKLIELIRKDPNSAEVKAALVDTLGAERLQKGTAYTGEGADFVWAVESAGTPQLRVDDQPGPA